MKLWTKEQLKPYYGEIIWEARKLCLYRKTNRNNTLPPAIDGFLINISTNRKIYIFEADVALFQNSRAINVGKDKYYTTTGFKILENLSDLDGLYDGSSNIEIEGNTLYTDKPGSWIGKGGAHVKLLSKYFGRVNIKKKEQ